MNLNINYLKYHASFHFIRCILPALLAILLSGCEKSLEPEYPDFLLSNTAIFEDVSTVDAALSYIYAGLRDQGPISGGTDGMTALLGLYSDELDYYRADSPIDNAFFNHTVLPNNAVVEDFWNNSYTLIYQANAIIEGLNDSSLSNSEKQPFLGEAHFLRAYLHFYLAQLYGDVPYLKTTDYIINSTVYRMPLEMVYTEIVEDLNIAKNLLPDMDNTGEKLRVSKGVATAMLANLYLVNRDWDKAFEESNNVISSGLYSWQPALNEVFLKESSSTIWQIKPEYEGSGTLEGETFIFDFGPPYYYALTENFMSNFEYGDQRKEIWTRQITEGTISWFHPYKYKQSMYEGSSMEYSILFRLAEQYLIRAEAALHLGNLQEAKNDINTIRLRAGLQPTNANSQDQIMEELIHQRRYELFTEQGRRWFDLKRIGMTSQILGPLKSGWKSTDILFPLPQKELLLNPNLNPQNPGY